MVNKNISPPLIHIILFIALACALRLYFFSGFVLGDDPAYADFVSRILKGSYPEIGTHGVFACRPAVLYALALPVYLFGWHEWSFVLPVLVASLLNTGLVYCAARRLSGQLAGAAAAMVYITFPLDAVHATTVSNDIILSAFVWSGALLLLISYKKYNQKKYLALSTLAGFIIGAAVAVKINAVVFAAVAFPALIFFLWSDIRRGGYKTILGWSIGWIIANVLLCLFLYMKSGDPFAHYHAEMRFNLDFNPSGFIAGDKSLARLLLYYPRLICGMEKEGDLGYQMMPYGYVFLCFLLLLPCMLVKRFRSLRLPAGCALLYLLIMQFSPLKLFPHYIPIHRLPRFLHIASLPAIVAIGIAFSVFLRMRGKAVKLAAVIAFLFLTFSSFFWSHRKAAFYNDCALDQRWAWDIVSDASAKSIITDMEMRNYLMFRSGFALAAHIDTPAKLPDQIPPDSLVIAGGARRPDMYAHYASDWSRNRQNKNWAIISEAPFELKPWRRSKLRLYRVMSDGGAAPESRAFTTEDDRIVPARHITPVQGMIKIAELDVGDVSSEMKLTYQIVNSSWSGIRDFTYPDETSCKDDGRAHRDSERLTLDGLVPGRQLVILKRLDPTVAHQAVKVYFNGTFINEWSLSEGGLPGYWHESMFTIPGEAITVSKGIVSFSFAGSDFDINSFYYWFFQPR
ncbi:MAG: glycosyltransferase family 39 protein [Pseudomonadota bacterium]